MRARQTQKNLPITARTLETMIRLASAGAKARLSADVLVCDVLTALELMNFVLFHEVGEAYEKPTTTTTVPLIAGKLTSNAVKKGQMKGGVPSSDSSPPLKKIKTLADDFTSGSDSGENMDEAEEEDDEALTRARRLLSRTKKTLATDEEAVESDEPLPPVDENSDAYKELLAVLIKMGESYGETIEIGDLMARLNSPQGGITVGPFSRRLVDHMLLHLEVVNKVMYQDGWVHIL